MCSIVGGANLLPKEVLDVPFGDKVADSLPWEDASHMSSACHFLGVPLKITKSISHKQIIRLAELRTKHFAQFHPDEWQK